MTRLCLTTRRCATAGLSSRAECGQNTACEQAVAHPPTRRPSLQTRPRTLVILLVVLGVALPVQAQDWNTDYRQLQELLWKHKYAEALELDKRLLGIYHEEEQVYNLYVQRVHAFRALKKFDEAFAETLTLDKAGFSKNRKLLARVYHQFAWELHKHRQADKAIKVYHLLIEKCPAETDYCAQARIAAGDCYRYHVKNGAEQAAAEYAAVEKDYRKEEKHPAAAVSRLADTLRGLKKHADAVTEYRKALTTYRRFYRATDLERLTCSMGHSCAESKDWEKARAAYRDAEALSTRDNAKNELAWRRANILFGQKQYAAAIVELQQTLSRYGIADAGRCLDAARKIAECHAAMENYEDALKAAHIVHDAGDPPWAVRNIVTWLKVLDGNDERVETFILFQMHGPKGADGKGGLPNVLAEIGYPNWSAEVRKDFEKSFAALTDDWRDLQRKARVCVYRGKPRDALPYYYRAFLNCSNDYVYSCGQAFVFEGLRAVHGTEAGLDPWYAFLRDGTIDKAIEPELRTLPPRKATRHLRTPKVLEVLDGLGTYIVEPFPGGGGRWAERTRRITLMNACYRMATEKGCEDRFLDLGRRMLATPGFHDLYDPCARAVSLMLRTRDGHLANARRWFADLADRKKTPNMSQRARQAVKKALGELSRTNSWKRHHAPNIYRRYLPKKPKKKK